MSSNKFVLLLVCFFWCFVVSAEEWTPGKVRAIGKNLGAMAGFYSECDKKDLVNANFTAARWASLMSAKYLIVAGIEEQHIGWVEKGRKGTLIEDPELSEKSVVAEFTKETCGFVKELLDKQYEIGAEFVFGKNNVPD